MANTYTLISSNVLSSSAASVTFSAIPATYTDLILRYSARGDDTGTNVIAALTYNGASTNFSDTYFYGTGSATNSQRHSAAAYSLYYGGATGNGATANTFGSSEIYIPSYTASQNKPASVFTTTENNATAATIGAAALLWSNTAAITSITLTPFNGTIPAFLSGSSFYLYGIKNS